MPHDKDHPLHFGDHGRDENVTRDSSLIAIPDLAFDEICRCLKNRSGNMAVCILSEPEMASADDEIHFDGFTLVRKSVDLDRFLIRLPNDTFDQIAVLLEPYEATASRHMLDANGDEYIDLGLVEFRKQPMAERPVPRFKNEAAPTVKWPAGDVEQALKRFHGEAAGEVLCQADLDLLEERCFFPGWAKEHGWEWHRANLKKRGIAAPDTMADIARTPAETAGNWFNASDEDGKPVDLRDLPPETKIGIKYGPVPSNGDDTWSSREMMTSDDQSPPSSMSDVRARQGGPAEGRPPRRQLPRRQCRLDRLGPRHADGRPRDPQHPVDRIDEGHGLVLERDLQAGDVAQPDRRWRADIERRSALAFRSRRARLGDRGEA